MRREDVMDIEKLAKEAGLDTDWNDLIDYAFSEEMIAVSRDDLKNFAQAVRRETLEEAAKVCDRRYMGDNNREDMEARACAAAIRAIA